MRLTTKKLRDLGACPSGRIGFRLVFPKGAPLTARSIRLARAADLQLGWLKRCVSNAGLCPKTADCRICDDRRKDRVRTSLRKLLRVVRS